jgi:hypothetical protein
VGHRPNTRPRMNRLTLVLSFAFLLGGCAVASEPEHLGSTRQAESSEPHPTEVPDPCDDPANDQCMVAPDDGIDEVIVHGSPRPTPPVVWTDLGGGTEPPPPPPPDQNPCLGPGTGGGGCAPVPPEDSGEEDSEEARRRREEWLNACNASVISSALWGGFCALVQQTYGVDFANLCRKQHMTTQQAKRGWCGRYWDN